MLGKLTGYFFNHINKTDSFYSHKNITSYGIPATISKIVHSSLLKNMKCPIQIKRGECYSSALSKNQLYKHKNQIHNVPTISKQNEIELFSKISARHFTNACNLL